jgi:RecA/RadA recombinase
MLAAAQASCGGQVAWVDASGDLDIRHLAFCGINLANLHLLKPRATSQAVAVCAELLVCGDFDLTVMDSLDHLDMRRTAGLVDHLMRRVLPDMARSVTVALFLSQPQTRLAGMAHAATLRLALQPQGVVWHAHRAVGWHTEVTVIKNRLGRAGLSARLFLPLPPP